MLVKLIVVLIFVVQVAWCERESVKRCTRAANACLLIPQGTEGPYYWNATIRRDITEGKPSISLRLVLTVLDVNTCLPVINAIVDLWHCDAVGICPHFAGSSPEHIDEKSDNAPFLRGQQITDKNGVVIFDTIYPGWYINRAAHIHVTVHMGATSPTSDRALYVKDGHVFHTGQLYFNDHLTDKIATVFPYSTNSIRRTRNEEDGIYSQANGSTIILPVKFLTNELTGGMKTKVTFTIDPTAMPTVLQKALKVLKPT